MVNQTMKFLNYVFILAIMTAIYAGKPSESQALSLGTEGEDSADQEYYEIRIYKIFDYEKQQIAENYLQNALIPALNRMGVDRVGVFRNLSDENDHSLFMLIPFSSIEQFTNMNQHLADDPKYKANAEVYFKRNKKTALYQRIESRFMKAFKGIPVLEIPSYSTEKKDRLFELRLYESPTEDHARRKVKMFNEGEIDIMRDVKLAPIFFGETLIAPDVPNLVYMLSGTDEESHGQHWKDFLAHPEWIRIKELEEYKGTVSSIKKWMLTPTSYSQL